MIDEDNRVVAGEEEQGDLQDELSLRPQSFSQYIGQKRVKSEMETYIQATKKRDKALDHVLLCGPPGLGKTTMASVIMNGLGVNLKNTSGPAVERAGDLVALLSDLGLGDVLFIDEIHRLAKPIEETLYSAMEDYYVDIIVGEGSTNHAVHVPLSPFTLIGATTRVGDLSAPLRDRFGIIEYMQYYTIGDLERIIQRSGEVFVTKIGKEVVHELARRSRGTPRVTNRLLGRVRNYAQVKEENKTSLATTKYALDQLQVDNEGLDLTDRKILRTIIEAYHGGPVGVRILAANIGEDIDTIGTVYKLYLLQHKFITMTSRGRVATQKTYLQLGIPLPEKS